MTPGFIIAAPASGGGKTVITLACLRHFKNAGLSPAAFKTGPDYIDPVFHAEAGGRACFNLDPWAMRAGTLGGLIAHAGAGADLICCEGVMGLFDGIAGNGVEIGGDDGSTANLAARTNWPVVLVVDARKQGASAAATVRGFAHHRDDVDVAGVIFNCVASLRHQELLTKAMADCLPDIPVLGCLPFDSSLALPERHLGLVQAGEHEGLGVFLEYAARVAAAYIDMAALKALARPAAMEGSPSAIPATIPPLGQVIAVARDKAFAFVYPALIEGWQAAGAEIVFFSPLDDDAPDDRTDAVFLPGGYPELHAGRLAANTKFLAGLRDTAGRDACIYGECGGYMVLGESLTDAEGESHAMAGLLPLSTSFAKRRLHLGYRQVTLMAAGPLGAAGDNFRGHEFHYATVTAEGPGDKWCTPLFTGADAGGGELGPAGLRKGRVFGSFVHLIDRS